MRRVRIVVLVLLAGSGVASAGIVPEPVQRAYRATKRLVGKKLDLASGAVRLRLDRAESALVASGNHELAARLTVVREKTRPLSPLRLSAFSMNEVSRRPALLPAYLSVSLPLDVVGFALSSTMSFAHALAFSVASFVPQQLVSQLAAHHIVESLTADRDHEPTLRHSLRGLTQRYEDYGARRDHKIARIAELLER